MAPSTVERRVLRWLLALVLLTEDDLAVLCRVPPDSVHSAVGTLRAAGWLFGLTVPGSTFSDEHAEHVLTLTPTARTMLDRDFDRAQGVLLEVAWWQCPDRAFEAAVAQAPVTRAAARAVVAMARAVDAAGRGALSWAALLPEPTAQGRLPTGAYDLPPDTPGGHVEVRWEDGAQEVWLGIYVDSGLAPSVAWQRLRARWRRVREQSRAAASARLLILCRNAFDLAVWNRLLYQAADGVEPDDLPQVSLALLRRAQSEYMLEDRVWFIPRFGRWRSLSDHVRRRERDDDAAPDAEDTAPPAHEQWPEIGTATEAAAARRALERPGPRATKLQQLVALGLQLSGAEHHITDLLARAPGMSVTDIVRYSGDPAPLVRRQLRVLRDAGVAMVGPSEDGPRWALLPAGRDLVAARAGFVRGHRAFATAAALQPQGEPTEPVSAHQAGIGRMIGLIAAAARRTSSWRLVAWYDEWYWQRELRRRAPRPDALVVLEGPDRAQLVFVCEYEHAVPGRQQADRKVQTWATWHLDRDWSNDLRGVMRNAAPLVWVIYGDAARAAGSLVSAVEALLARFPIVVGPIDRIDAPDGLHARVWRQAGGGGTTSVLARAAGGLLPRE